MVDLRGLEVAGRAVGEPEPDAERGALLKHDAADATAVTEIDRVIDVARERFARAEQEESRRKASHEGDRKRGPLVHGSIRDHVQRSSILPMVQRC